MLGDEYTILKTFEDDELEKQILKPLDSLITNVTKYTILPICVCNVLISKINCVPKMVLAAYDDKALMTEVSASDFELETVLMDKSPDEVVSPTVIVYSNDIPRSSVLFDHDEMYHYGSSYLIYAKGLKDAIKNKSITKAIVYKSGNKCGLKFESGTDLYGIMSPLTDSASIIRLPISNYSKKHPAYSTLFSKIANQQGEIISDQEYLANLFAQVKDMQSCSILATDNITLFKDFMKQKPTALVVYSNREKDASSLGVKLGNDLGIVDVALEMSFSGAKVTHFVFYRYIENIVSKIVGNYDEL